MPNENFTDQQIDILECALGLLRKKKTYDLMAMCCNKAIDAGSANDTHYTQRKKYEDVSLKLHRLYCSKLRELLEPVMSKMVLENELHP